MVIMMISAFDMNSPPMRICQRAVQRHIDDVSNNAKKHHREVHFQSHFEGVFSFIRQRSGFFVILCISTANETLKRYEIHPHIAAPRN